MVYLILEGPETRLRKVKPMVSQAYIILLSQCAKTTDLNGRIERIESMRK